MRLVFKKETAAFFDRSKKADACATCQKRTKTEHLLRRLVKEGCGTFQRKLSSLLSL